VYSLSGQSFKDKKANEVDYTMENDVFVHLPLEKSSSFLIDQEPKYCL